MTSYEALYEAINVYVDNLREALHARVWLGREKYQGAWLTMPLEQLERELEEEEQDAVIYRLMLKLRAEEEKGGDSPLT